MYRLPKTSARIFRDEVGFEHSKKLLKILGGPQNAHKAIHVAGTSGKGSVCYLIDAMLRAHGHNTGLLVSPHVYDIRERIQLNGQLISERKFVHIANKMLLALSDSQPSYFEALTCMGFLAAAHEDVDYLVVETGFGGLWDTTNAITREDKLSVISQIGFDHTAILGDTLEKIALQKAGIIQEGCQVVIGKQTFSEAEAVLLKNAKEKNARVELVGKFDDYQQTNDALARTVVRQLAQRDSWQFDDAIADEALERIFIPGRFEKRSLKNHLVILDGAHNQQKLEALTSRLKKEGLTPATFIFAIGERKDWKNCIETIKPYAARIIATEFFTSQADSPKNAVSAKVLAEYCKKLRIESIAYNKPAQALQHASEYSQPIVATGSFYLLSELDSLI